MTSSTTTPSAAHILVIPYPSQGHMIPLLDLTHHLLSNSSGRLSATVVVTPNNLPILDPLLSSHPPSSIASLVLPFPPHPSLPSGAENSQHLPPNSFLAIMSTLHRLRRPLINWFSSHPSPPSSIISDMFLGWTHRLASQLGIKRFVFSPSGSLAFSLADSVWKDLPPIPRSEDGTNTIDQNAVVSFDRFPGQPRFPWSHLSVLYKAYASGDPATEFLRVNWEDNSASWGLVVNTFADLERPYLSYLSSDLGYDRVWAVGPLLPMDGELGCGPNVRGGSGPVEGHVLSWLDTCGDGHVVYVCFGTQAVLTNQQMEVLAVGLETSGVRFVWKIKEPSDGHVDADRFGKLPRGFEDRVAGRGLVIRHWVPQVSILRHRAVGAFLTHCGWNSVLEGLSAGTMILAWPQGADQFFNATLLVEWLRVGVRVGQGPKSLPDPDELARVIAGSLSGAYKEQRLKALELKKKAAEAVKDGGSSLIGLDSLVHHLFNLPKPDAEVLRRCKTEAEEEERAGGG